ncbi:hypothetical protein, partial [Streptococcus pneumoniae]|uniref:hypothetical protein n=1 Tax=Streptococcus pneumoniae TaxID=1313 RepID=UPI001E2F932A
PLTVTVVVADLSASAMPDVRLVAVPVAFVSTTADGVPKSPPPLSVGFVKVGFVKVGFVKVGDVDLTRLPVPVTGIHSTTFV